MRKFLLSALACFLAVAMAFAQQTVTGVVTASEDGLPIPGVTVRVQGSTVGTATDINGRYAITVQSGSDTLVFSFVGMRTMEVEVETGGP